MVKKYSWLWGLIVLVLLTGGWAIQQQKTAKKGQTAATVTHNTHKVRPKSAKITVNIGKQRLTAHLNQSIPARQLQRQLPLTLHFDSFGSGFDEKIADLSKSLSTTGTPTGANPRPGDIAYWSPQPRIVFYWGDVGYYDGIHIIGHFDQRQHAMRVIRQHTTGFTVKIT